jgi:hypothetical protein
VIRKLAAWAAPAGSIAAVLCAVIAVMYANSVRVAVSLPTAANIVDASPAQLSGPGASAPGSALTLVHPLHSVEVFDGQDNSTVAGTTAQPGDSDATGVTAGDDNRPSPSARPTPRTSASKTATTDTTDDSTATPAPSTATPTDTWADDDHPSRSPGPSTSPTGTRSVWPTWSHGDDNGDSGGDDGTSDDDGDEATSTASPSP